MSSKYSKEIYDFSILLIFLLANVSLGFGDHGNFLCKLREKVKIPKDRPNGTVKEKVAEDIR